MEGSENEKRFDRVFNPVRMRRLSIALEAIDAIFQVIMESKEKPIRFTDGTTGRLKPFIEPRFDNEGDPEAAVDVKIYDMSGTHVGHLEIEINMSGWGGMPGRF